MGQATVSAEKFAKRVTVELNPLLHSRMRELSKRKRVQIGVLYEQALQIFLDRPENYMGIARTPRKVR